MSLTKEEKRALRKRAKKEAKIHKQRPPRVKKLPRIQASSIIKALLLFFVFLIVFAILYFFWDYTKEIGYSAAIITLISLLFGGKLSDFDMYVQKLVQSDIYIHACVGGAIITGAILSSLACCLILGNKTKKSSKK